MNDAEMLLLMRQALETPYGLSLSVSNPDAFKRVFYKVRALHREDIPDLDNLTVKLRPNNNKSLWLLKKET